MSGNEEGQLGWGNSQVGGWTEGLLLGERELRGEEGDDKKGSLDPSSGSGAATPGSQSRSRPQGTHCVVLFSLILSRLPAGKGT